MSEAGGRRTGGRRKRGVAAPAGAPAAAAPTADGPAAAEREPARPAEEPSATSGDAARQGSAGASAPGAGGPGSGATHVDLSVCLCAGLGPLLTQALRNLAVPEEVKRSVHETEREALRLLRTLIEMRLSTLSPEDAPGQEPRRGVRLDVS